MTTRRSSRPRPTGAADRGRRVLRPAARGGGGRWGNRCRLGAGARVGIAGVGAGGRGVRVGVRGRVRRIAGGAVRTILRRAHRRRCGDRARSPGAAAHRRHARAATGARHRRSRHRARWTIRRTDCPEGEGSERARRVEDGARARYARRGQDSEPAPPGSGGRSRSFVLSAGEAGGRHAHRGRRLSLRDAALVPRQSPCARHAQHACAGRNDSSGSVCLERRGW